VHVCPSGGTACSAATTDSCDSRRVQQAALRPAADAAQTVALRAAPRARQLKLPVPVAGCWRCAMQMAVCAAVAACCIRVSFTSWHAYVSACASLALVSCSLGRSAATCVPAGVRVRRCLMHAGLCTARAACVACRRCAPPPPPREPRVARAHITHTHTHMRVSSAVRQSTLCTTAPSPFTMPARSSSQPSTFHVQQAGRGPRSALWRH
jgi:hypothetical protein